MASIIRNARVETGTWKRCSKGWQRDPDGKGPYFGIVDDDSPDVAPEIYKTEAGAKSILAHLRANSSSRGIIFLDDE